MRKAAREFGRYCSRRAWVLIMFGAVFLLSGYSLISIEADVASHPAFTRSYVAHLELFSIHVWGWLFIASGITALLAALAGRHAVGFSVLMGISSWWAFEFIATWITTGYTRAVLGAATWGLLVGLLAVIVGWKDPPPVGLAEILKEVDGE